MTLEPIYQRRRQKISLTALIDVVFILLMFFMLTSSFTNWRQIELKTPMAAVTAAEQPKPVLAVLDAGGRLSLEGQEVAINEISANVLERADWYAGQRPVVLVPMADVSMQQIVTALERLQAAGVSRLTLGNAREERP